MIQYRKVIFIISVYFEISDKIRYQYNQSLNVSVFFRRYQFLRHFLIRAAFQLNSMLTQFLFQMCRDTSSVFIRRKCINKRCSMFFMKKDFIIYCLFVHVQLFFSIKRILTIFCNSKMFNIYLLSILTNDKIGSIWFTGQHNIIFIYRFVLVINIIKIEKISNLYFLIRTYYFILNRYFISRFTINYFCPKIFKFTSHGCIICMCHMIKKVINIIPFIRRIKI